MNKISRQAIYIEVCKPRDRDEKGCLGTTSKPNNHSFCEMWLDSEQPKDEFIDTFFHEVTHAFIGMYFKQKLSEKTEHRMCELIGYFAKSVITGYVKLKR